jgi:hypothetical protein
MRAFKKWLVVSGLVSFLVLQPLSLLADGEEQPPHGKPPGNGGGPGGGGINPPPIVGEDSSINLEIWQGILDAIQVMKGRT